MKKIDKRIVVYRLIFIAGVCIMLYPTISNMWNEHLSASKISTYEADIKNNEGILEKELEIAKQYNENLLPKRVPDAFSIRDGIVDEEYEKVLNISGNGMMGYISIPTIDVEVPIYHYTNEESLKKGAGHLLGSSLPIGGKGTHSVISAHRGLPSAKLFSDLNLLGNGDSFYIHVLGKILRYEVDQVLVVDPDETESLAIDEMKDYVTLVTCTPYGVNTHRLLVRGQRVTNDKEPIEVAKKRDYKKIAITLLCIVAGVLLAYGITYLTEKRRRINDARDS